MMCEKYRKDAVAMAIYNNQPFRYLWAKSHSEWTVEQSKCYREFARCEVTCRQYVLDKSYTYKVNPITSVIRQYIRKRDLDNAKWIMHDIGWE